MSFLEYTNESNYVETKENEHPTKEVTNPRKV